MTYPDLPESRQKLEEECLTLWREEGLFEKTVQATAEGEPFVFYEGPPTANGKPGLHHLISRTIKDLVCRHRTMQGRQITRIAGWDTHGLPVEIEAEKRLGISGKPEIEAFGVARFNEACRESVFTYKDEWEALSERIGYWLDYSNPYVTFHTDYIESVWWILAQLAERDLLYRGFKSVPYCPRCGTALSSHEVAQGYQDVVDSSIFFLAPVLAEDGSPDPEGRAFVVWTTTPWTVPSNSGLAVHPELQYVEVQHEGRRLIVAEARAEAVFEGEVEFVGRVVGSDLVGLRYARFLDFVPAPEDPMNGWTVVAEDFVSAEEGTGVVHMAPAFGADDYASGRRHGLPMLLPIDDTGSFEESVGTVGGMFVKDADAVVVEALREKGYLFRTMSYQHSYPHCWRCESPLIYMARTSWFAATSTLRAELLANNDRVAWYPPEVGEKRFGEWLRGNVDWALSRDRYWGTPLPAWVCDRDGSHVDWIGSLAELRERAGSLPDDFDPHRPTIDEITWSCSHAAGGDSEDSGEGDGVSRCAGTMHRTPEVIDAWFDSGAMPWAQWHYPFENRGEWERHFPADFICEGLDQTRGWFYSLIAISTMLGQGPSFLSVLVNDMILDAEGQKMSKSRGNMVDPWDAIADHGVDALRWYFVTSSNPWVPKRYDPDSVHEAARKFFDTLANTYRFFALYANTEGWAPTSGDPPPEERTSLDRWLLSRLAHTVSRVSEELEAYQITRAYRGLADFLTDELSNWYVRRSRPRFWGNTNRSDADAAFRTLWDALSTVALLLAPVAPFAADWYHRALAGESAHLTGFPQPISGHLDADLDEEMASARVLVSLGRSAREEVQIRVRQPLRRAHAVLHSSKELRAEILELVKDELNVREVGFLADADELVSLVPKPNFRALGPRFGKQSEAAASAIHDLGQAALKAYRSGDAVSVEVDGVSHALEPGDLDVIEASAEGLVVKSEQGTTVALDPLIDEDLRAEGLARELVNRIQRLRKDAGLVITDRISLGVYGPDVVKGVLDEWGVFITAETLATKLQVGPGLDPGEEPPFDHWLEIDVDGTKAVISLTAVAAAD